MTYQKKDYEKIGRMMEDIMSSGYAGTNRLLWYSFLRGLAYGTGIFLAGTVVVGAVIWGLSFFDQVPLIGTFIQHIINTLHVKQLTNS